MIGQEIKLRGRAGRRFVVLAAAGAFFFAAGLDYGQKPSLRPRPAVPIMRPADRVIFSGPLGPSVSGLSAMPGTISFTAGSPGGGVAGSSNATVTWTLTSGISGHTWTLKVGTASATFTGCATVPESAVSFSCVSASHTGAGTASCQAGGPWTLRSGLPGQQVASGNDGGSTTHSYTVVVSYTFADSWRYIANTCPLNLTYTVDAP